MAERAPLFYRSPDDIANMLHAGYFRTAFREALLQLPTSTHFRDSHFGEILSGIFAEAAIGWRLLYSKSLLSHIFSATAASEGLGNPVARAS